MKTMIKTVFAGLAALCVSAFETAWANAGEFLTQAEIDRRLDELRRPDGSGLAAWIFHGDRCYDTNSPFEPYEYRCPICGNSTWYRDKILIGNGTDIAKYLAWARETVEELRALRLDVRLDERTLCATCRCELKIPDGGEIIGIPELWPGWSGKDDVFPFAIGEKVDIVHEPYRNVFGVVRSGPRQTYWVRAKELEAAIERKDEELMDVYLGPDEKYPKHGRVTCWAFGCRMPEVVTNGWARYQPYESLLNPTSIKVPKAVIGNLTYAGAKTSRTDIFTPIWTINGKRVEVGRGDEVLLKKFLLSEHPGDDEDLRCGMERLVRLKRLELLLNPNIRDDEKMNWSPSSCRDRLGPGEQLPKINFRPYDDDEVEVEVDI